MTWARPTSKYGMHRFTCDYPHYQCTEEFRSASIPGVLADQLLASGWRIVIYEAMTLTPFVKFVTTLVGTVERRFLCPAHRPVEGMVRIMAAGGSGKQPGE